MGSATRFRDVGFRPAADPGSWQFWMQVTRHQFEDGRSGFTFDAAIAEINSKGYFLFTGSPKLLSKLAPSPVSEGPSNV